MAAATHILGIETSCDETAAAVVRRLVDGSGEIVRIRLSGSSIDVENRHRRTFQREFENHRRANPDGQAAAWC